MMESKTTCIRAFEKNFKWTIENFHLCPKTPNQKLTSEIFSAPDENEVQWQLQLYPYGIGPKNESEGYVSLTLLHISTTRKPIALFYNMKIESKDGKCLKEHKFYQDSIRADPLTEQVQFIKRDELDNLLDDTLVVKCWVRWGSGATTNIEKITPTQPDQSIKLSSDFKKLMERGNLSDVTLVAEDGTKLLAHKCILAARSSVFAATFEHDMKENKELIVEIEDLNANTIQSMLDFIYTGELNEEKSKIEDVLAAANEYDLENLKTWCESILINNLNVENVADYLLLADNHYAESLKTESLNYLVSHLNEIIDAESFKVINEPSLLKDILKVISIKYW